VLQNADCRTVIFLDEIKGTDFVELAEVQLALIDYCRRLNVFIVDNADVKD
jgi:hypothetical protein